MAAISEPLAKPELEKERHTFDAKYLPYFDRR
jgi:hypothetical protein